MVPLAYAVCLAAIALACAPLAHGQVVAHGEFEMGGVEYSPLIAPAVFVAVGLFHSVFDWYLDSPRKVGKSGFRRRRLIWRGAGGAILGMVAFGAIDALWQAPVYEMVLADENGHVKTNGLLFATVWAYLFVVGFGKVGKVLAVLVFVHNRFAGDPPAPVS